MTPVAEAAERLATAARTGIPCAPVRDLLGTTDVASAYAVQQLLSRRRSEAGARIVGRKIGLTAASVQRQLGVDQPDFGALFDDMEVAHRGRLPWPATMQPKIEVEIAFVLSRDLITPRPTAADIIGSIDYAVAALEIVGSRIRDWDIGIVDTVADNASSSHFVLGHQPRRLADIDVEGCGMALERRGEVVSTGMGAACLGSPLNAVHWLARTLAESGEALRQGDIVLSGALGPMASCAPGDVFLGRVEGLGAVQVSFGDGA